MPIEIKELHIQIKVTDELKEPQKNSAVQQSMAGLKEEVVRTCTREILEILKEKQER